MKWKKLYETIKAKVAKNETLTQDEKTAWPMLQKQFEPETKNVQVEVPDTAHNAAAFIAECQKNETVDDNRDGVLRATQKMQESAFKKAPYAGEYDFDVTGDLRQDYQNILQAKVADHRIKAIQDLNDALIVMKAICGIDSSKRGMVYHLNKSLTNRLIGMGVLSKAMHTTNEGSGLEFINDSWSGQLLEKIELMKRLPNLFQMVSMTTKKLTIPVAGTGVMAYKLLEATSDTPWLKSQQASSQGVGTSNMTLETVDMGFNTHLSYQAVEDSIIALLPYIREFMAASIVNSTENAFINGDIESTHMDDTLNHPDPEAGNGTSVSSDRLWKGVRKLSSEGSLTVDMSTFTIDAVLTLFAKLGVYFMYGAPVTSPSLKVYFRMLKLKDADGRPAVMMRDTAGDYATLFSGQLPQIFGVPIIVSAYTRDNLDDTGVSSATAENNVKSCMPVYATKMFKRGIRSQVLIEAEKIPAARQYGIYVTARGDLKPIVTPSEGDPICACGINISPTD